MSDFGHYTDSVSAAEYAFETTGHFPMARLPVQLHLNP